MKMGKIIIYDDEPLIVKQLKAGIRKVELTPIEFTDLERLREFIKSDENWSEIQALILDLAQAMEVESGTKNYAILEDIKYCYKNRRVPILIHSAFAEQVEDLQGLPTVFLYKKGRNAIRKIRQDLETMKISGFLDLFSDGPLLDDQTRIIQKDVPIGTGEIKQLLHTEFVTIFRDTDNILDELNRIIMENTQPELVCFERFLKPIIGKIRSD